MVRNAAKACTRLKKYDRRRRICRRSGEPPCIFRRFGRHCSRTGAAERGTERKTKFRDLSTAQRTIKPSTASV